MAKPDTTSTSTSTTTTTANHALSSPHNPQKNNKQQLMMNLPGTREEDCFGWTFDSIEEITTPHAAQQYLQSQVRIRRFDIDSLIRQPRGVGRLAWLYEHMRQVCIELGFYISLLRKECTESRCPVMRAGEATYYCAGHGHPRPCSAIGYAVHTIDYAVQQLSGSSSSSLLAAIDAEENQINPGGELLSLKHFQSMVRRLYRIFAHAYFHHRDLFEQQESATYLYARFVRLARKYELTPESLVTIPDLPAAVAAASVAS
ncbi:hypothetical protein H4S06_000431 [Coemansia sp. BCRC 34490]|nr:hypothetical protein H4S06_000431 [Coemansia sp. BCRC 34490]